MHQLYENYTSEDLEVWQLLFNRQVENLKEKASSNYLFALKEMEDVLNPSILPNFEDLNQWFSDKTGWKIQCVAGLIPVDEFFELLADKKFPSSTWLRTIVKLDYLEEPDMFHDIFGHIPLLSQPAYSEFVHRFGILGKSMICDEAKLLMLQRLYWFTIEFGLIKEAGQLKIYGAGIISSFGESISSLISNEIERIDFDTDLVVNTSFCTSEMQTKYFVIDSLEDLNKSIIRLNEKFLCHEMEGCK